MKTKQLVRIARVFGLTLIIWPFAGTSGAPDQSTEGTWQMPEVSGCKADPRASGIMNKMEYDANGYRCVVGEGGCDFHAF